jgi:hypothetical protein
MDGDLRTTCAFYAQKYKYRADALERGLEGPTWCIDG